MQFDIDIEFVNFCGALLVQYACLSVDIFSSLVSRQILGCKDQLLRSDLKIFQEFFQCKHQVNLPIYASPTRLTRYLSKHVQSILISSWKNLADTHRLFLLTIYRTLCKITVFCTWKAFKTVMSMYIADLCKFKREISIVMSSYLRTYIWGLLGQVGVLYRWDQVH